MKIKQMLTKVAGSSQLYRYALSAIIITLTPSSFRYQAIAQQESLENWDHIDTAKAEKTNRQINLLIEQIYRDYELKIANIHPPDLTPVALEQIRKDAQELQQSWLDVAKPQRTEDKQIELSLLDAYQSTLKRSSQVKAYLESSSSRSSLEETDEEVFRVSTAFPSSSGLKFKQTRITIPGYDAETISDESIRQLAAHIQEVNRAYWNLYNTRSIHSLYQKQIADLEKIRESLGKQFDSISLADANLNSLLEKQTSAVRNSEDRLKTIIGDPDSYIGKGFEVIPTTIPVYSFLAEDVQDLLQQAFHNRPEIRQGFEQFRSSLKQLISKVENPQPFLKFASEIMSVDPTQDETKLASDLLREEMILRKQAYQLKTIIDTVILECIVAYRDALTAYQDVHKRVESLNKVQAISSSQELGEHLSKVEVQLLIDESQRVTDAKNCYLDSLVSYNIAVSNLARACGKLIMVKGVVNVNALVLNLKAQ